MDVSRYQHVETTTVAAPPQVVYDLVADVSRMGEWSPVSAGGEWDDDRAWFTGHNATPERTWSTRCRVEVADPGREFTFVNCGSAARAELVRWSYTFAAVPGGTEVSEAWTVLPGYDDAIHQLAPDMDVAAYLEGVIEPTRRGMALTLARLKAAAEA